MDASERKQALLYAVRGADLPQMERLLQEDGEVNALYPNGTTLLVVAIEGKELPIVEFLLRAGADPNQHDFHDHTPLIYAAGQGLVEIVRLLLDSGADVNARNRQGSTALMYAANSGSREVTELLLNAGAEVNATDKQNLTALNYVVAGDSAQVKKLLRARGGIESNQAQVVSKQAPTDPRSPRTLDEFSELKLGPPWAWEWAIFLYGGMLLLFTLDLALLPWLFFLAVALGLIILFPSVWKIGPLWRELRDRRAGRVPVANPAPRARSVAAPSSDVAFVSQLMEMGSRELSTIHRVQPDAGSLDVLTSLFRNRMISLLLVTLILLPVLALAWPKNPPIRIYVFDGLPQPLKILYWAGLILWPFWVWLLFRLETRLRLGRVRLIQQDRDRLAGQVSKYLNAEDVSRSELPSEFGLYLRAFMTTDKLHLKGFDLETLLAYSIAPTLPLVALGKPGEHLGAGRILTSNEGWQEEILHLMEAARLILIIPSHRAGTLWEIGTLRNKGFFEKTIFIMPPELNFHGGLFSEDWLKTVGAARQVGVEFPAHRTSGAFFRLDSKGKFEDYAPFASEEFLQEFDPGLAWVDRQMQDSSDTDSDSDADGDGDDAADGIDSGDAGSGFGRDGGDGPGDGGGYRD